MRCTEVIPVEVSAFSMQKLGNKPSQYEDSYYYELRKRKLAVADGASESCFAKSWADLLTSSFVQSDLSLFRLSDFEVQTVKQAFEPILASIREEWTRKIDWASLPWYIEEKSKRGAFATFLGVEFKRMRRKRKRLYKWRAVAVGDCCMFLLDDTQLQGSFPLTSSSEFGITPCLLSSNSNISSKTLWSIKEGLVKVGKSSRLVLATDAVAKWILQMAESGKNTWSNAVSPETVSRRLFLEELVNKEEIRNDDITILTLGFHSFLKQSGLMLSFKGS